MTIFKSAKVSELEARIVELEAENATLSESATSISERNEELAGANERIAELESANAEIPSLNAAIADHLATIASKDLQIAELTEKATITDEKISAAASQKLAAQGHGEPLKIEGSVFDKPENTKTRAEFEALSTKEKDDFILKQGGKIVG